MCALTRKEVCSVGKGWRIEVKDVSVVRFQSSFFFFLSGSLSVRCCLDGISTAAFLQMEGRKNRKKTQKFPSVNREAADISCSVEKKTL